MKNIFRTVSLVVTILILPLAVYAKPTTGGKPSPTPATSKIVILDPGHGGSDPGAIYNGLRESDVNLDIAYRLKEVLIANGYTVHMTRECDEYKTNNDRYTFANEMNGSMLISIHLNASNDHNINYTKGFYGKKGKDLDFTNEMHQALYPTLGIADGGVGQFASGVLLKSNMPSTIAETVFITNDYENSLLKDGTGLRQQKIANALYQGIVNSGL